MTIKEKPKPKPKSSKAKLIKQLRPQDKINYLQECNDTYIKIIKKLICEQMVFTHRESKMLCKFKWGERTLEFQIGADGKLFDLMSVIADTILINENQQLVERMNNEKL